MPKRINFGKLIEKQLPPELVNFMWVAGEMANSLGEKLYLVGGVVRDLLMEQPNFDLDLVVEGSAIELAQQLKGINKGKITTHPHFNTAKLQWQDWNIDLATARSETYEKPGALPAVTPSSIEKDLSRRDFSINAMAIRLNPGYYGKLVDPHGGRDDLQSKRVRILHDKSFTDDATRIWRALRYEQRLGFHLERSTQSLLQRDTAMLKTISADRIRYEIECIFNEKYPEKVINRAYELGVLASLQPSLKGDGALKEKFERARQECSPEAPSFDLYLALLAYPLTTDETEQLISRLNLPKLSAKTLRDTIAVKGKMRSLSTPGVSPSAIYNLLRDFSPSALEANSLATQSAVAGQAIHLFLNKLKDVQVLLTGDDLIQMGIPPGPQIKEILDLLHQAKLNGKITTRNDEEEVVRIWLDQQQGEPSPPS
jgi:tRNA nucleotidyltransferase (CCA-adding enzyme)